MSHCDGRTAVLIDSHPLWLNAVEPIISDLGITVVGTATSSNEALAIIQAQQPDIVVTGLKMADGDLDGIEMIRQARESVPTVKVVVLSMYDDTKHIDASFNAGAIAYVIKTAHPDDLRSAVRQAFSHSIYLSGARPAVPVAETQETELMPDLTRREFEILQLVAEGHSNSQLARMLWVTEQTVKFHLSNIYRKLDVSNRTEASRWAQLHGLLASRGTERVTSAA
jgi:DNA-binding NarL/FixJ family response regulator